jgi:hypothetical protein
LLFEIGKPVYLYVNTEIILVGIDLMEIAPLLALVAYQQESVFSAC